MNEAGVMYADVPSKNYSVIHFSLLYFAVEKL